jgi:hypothetical protein
MIFRCIVLVSSLALAGCCASGVGCATSEPYGVAWDGLGPAPEEQTVSSDSAPARQPSSNKRDRQQAARSNSNTPPGNQWEQEQASGAAADAKLTRQLKICSNC